MKHLFTFFLLFIFINHFAHAQWTDDPNNPLAICTAANGQSKVHAIGDNLGGAFVFWIDARDAVFHSTFNAQHSSFTLEVSQWQNGIYFCEARSGNEIAFSKFIVQH